MIGNMTLRQPQVAPNFVDSYTIYYGYTEIEFETSMDLWVAIGPMIGVMFG